MTSSLREPVHLIGSPYAIPRGIECVFEYNGFRFNDKRLADKIVITKIGGTDDPDVRDAREVNSDRDGETPLDALYGGRTISLQGYVYAGSLDRMRELYGQFKDAFDELVEKPLYFRWLDWEDTFIDSLALADYSYDNGSGTLSINADDSGLTPSTTAVKRIYLSVDPRYAYTNYEDIIKVVPTTAASQNVSVMATRVSATQYLSLGFTAGVLTIRANAGTTLASTGGAVSPPANQPFWIVGSKSGNNLRVEYWNTDPSLGGAPTSFVTHTLTAGNITLFGAAVSGQAGIEWTPVSTSDRIQLLDVGAADPGDTYIQCRKVAKLEADEVQTGFSYKRDFFLTLRASNPRFLSRKPTVVSAVPGSSTLTFPGSGGLAFAAPAVPIIFGVALPTITNLGRSSTFPIIRFAGPISNPALYNPANGTNIGINGAIATGDYYDIDCQRRTVVDAGGVSRYNTLTDETSWLSLERGANLLYGAADAATGLITVTYRHAWR